jgi:hypothetical protein
MNVSKGSEWMLTIIWAFSSMLVLMLIISFLPIGFTLKAKLFISLVGFVLALGGLAATSSFPLWQTALMLAVLIFISAYFMDRRVGALLYKGIPAFGDVVLDEVETPLFHNPIAIEKEDNLVNLAEAEIVFPTFNIKNSITESSLVSSQPEFIPEMEKDKEIVDEDISYLIDRISESEFVDLNIESEPVTDYLSEIESLLEVEKTAKNSNNNWPENIAGLPTNKAEDSLPKDMNEDKIEPLDDKTFDFLFAAKEVAGGLNGDEDETKEKVAMKNN